MSGWNNLSGGTAVAVYVLETAAPYAGANSLKVILSQAGANPWDAQTLGPTLDLSVGQTYTLEFKARAAAAGSTARMVIQNNSYLSKDFVLTEAWADYSWTFTAQETAPQLKMHHFDPGTYWFDNLALEGDTSENAPVTLRIVPEKRHQMMIGFGGALTWYSERVLSSPHRTELTRLLFDELGADIIRFKNWYYPDGYPATTDPEQIGSERSDFFATREFFQLARAADPEVKVLLSSWSPPAGLKGNGSQREGTLKQEGGVFVYDALAQYWVDSLDHIGFEPDYISIQNEPGFITPDWDTCAWRPWETEDYPSYTIAFDRVYDRIKDRENPPLMIGPEVENVGWVSWGSNTFEEFTAPLKGKDHLAAYAYHLYNFSSAASMEGHGELNAIRTNYADKPNFMTEFSKSSMDWLDSALAIHHSVTEANAAAYIYWELAWDAGSPSAAIGLTAGGDYSVGPHYYTIKHFSKFIDQGFQRLELTGQSALCRATAYVSPSGKRVVVVALNRGSGSQSVSWDLPSLSVTSASGYQSTDDAFFQELASVDTADTVVLPARSLTTFVIDLDQSINADLPVAVVDYSLRGGVARLEIESVAGDEEELWKNHSLSPEGWAVVEKPEYRFGQKTTTILDTQVSEFPLFYKVTRAR